MGMEDLSPEEQEFGIWLQNGIATHMTVAISI